MTESVIIGAKRSPIGIKNGQMVGIRPDDLASQVVKGLIDSVKINTADVNDFRWVAFVDADGAISSQETLRFLSLATQDNAEKKKCLWSIRVKGQGKDIQRTPIRNILGNVFRVIVNCLFNIPVKDTQCGLKCIPLKAYHEIRNRLTERRFVFDVELASLLIRKKYQLEQVAIDWQESPGSTVKISSAFRMAASLLIIRLRLFLDNNN